jgi:hypothetical protein
MVKHLHKSNTLMVHLIIYPAFALILTTCMYMLDVMMPLFIVIHLIIKHLSLYLNLMNTAVQVFIITDFELILKLYVNML